LIIELWLALFAVFVGSYTAYFIYLKFHADKPWKLKLDGEFSPSVTILVPMYNEEKMIQLKLKNLLEVSYPKEKMEVILIDDASTDQTSTKAHEFAKNNPELSMKILSQYPRGGKSRALNKGLKVSSNDIIIMSDADTFWHRDILRQALPYLSDPTVGAITGHGIPSNSAESWVAKAEDNYMGLMFLLRLGESKIHSTIRFEGCFCAFKKNAFEQFDVESGCDDSGTALNVVENKLRAILVPEAFVFAEVRHELMDRVKAKIRRATQLTGLWIHCLSLLLKGRLMLPKRIAVPEVFLSLFNPIIFVALVFATVGLLVYYPILLVSVTPILCLFSLIPKTRSYLLLATLDQVIIFYSILMSVTKNRFVMWD
jgi:biofilm PGA synthesis N-glycosyltransferase PgaC